MYIFLCNVQHKKSSSTSQKHQEFDVWLLLLPCYIFDGVVQQVEMELHLHVHMPFDLNYACNMICVNWI